MNWNWKFMSTTHKCVDRSAVKGEATSTSKKYQTKHEFIMKMWLVAVVESWSWNCLFWIIIIALCLHVSWRRWYISPRRCSSFVRKLFWSWYAIQRSCIVLRERNARPAQFSIQLRVFDQIFYWFFFSSRDLSVYNFTRILTPQL